ncbi:hypothetical protein JXJ21_20285 [candidate division KSB1 bacterium]|nr:hypothetical protein [candidate division KSB1 bacterium]
MKSCLILTIIALGCTLRCSSSVAVLNEPSSENTFMVVGGVVLEDKYYSEYASVHLADIEVAILSQTVEGGELKSTGYWERTDENGFFMLSDVPPGRYAITGIRLYLMNGELAVFSNPLTSGNTAFMIQESDHVPFIGQYFEIEPQGRIVNLKNNLFIIDEENRQFSDINHICEDAFIGRKMVDGSVLKMISPVKYFVQKYPDSRWIPIVTGTF